VHFRQELGYDVCTSTVLGDAYICHRRLRHYAEVQESLLKKELTCLHRESTGLPDTASALALLEAGKQACLKVTGRC
jgi:hypothetical protein